MDDFREAFTYLRDNTPKHSMVLSWWDYGYQIAGMAERGTIVDNNTWNKTHIARVGKIFATNEREAWEMCKELDVDYVLVLFGGMVGLDGDDLNKLGWMSKIAAEEYEEIDAKQYRGPFNPKDAPEALKNSLMYKLSYYRFDEANNGEGLGFDNARDVNVFGTKIQLKYFKEAFTSINWMIRIYRPLPASSITPDYPSRPPNSHHPLYELPSNYPNKNTID